MSTSSIESATSVETTTSDFPSLEFFVSGKPRPQGSKKQGPQGQMYEAAKGLKLWRDTMTLTAMRARKEHGWNTALGAMVVVGTFYVPMSAGLDLKEKPYPIDPPDTDKYLRALGDSLKTAGIYKDDSQIICIVGRKFWAHDTAPGVAVAVTRLHV